MSRDLKDRIKSDLENWLQGLGYNYDKDLNLTISSITKSWPSYKLIADIVLMCIKKFNSQIGDYEAWILTTNFVDSIKSNLIINNKNFQKAFMGDFTYLSNSQDDMKVYLYNMKENASNSYQYLKNIDIENKTEERQFDLMLIINGFPLISIEIVESDFIDSTDVLGDYLENILEEFLMAYNFNRIIIFTDGAIFKLGTMYDFIEDYIEFSDESSYEFTDKKYSLQTLEELLNTKNVIYLLRNAKNTDELNSYIRKYDLANINNLDEKKFYDSIDNSTEIESPDDDENLEILLDFFNPNLNEVIFSDEFIEKRENSKETADFKENKSYIKDYQTNKNIKTLNTIVEANERLITKYVNKYKFYATTSMDDDDIRQFGYLGLLKAVDKFDCNMDFEFSTYSVNWIKQCIFRGLQDESLLIRIPVHQWENISKLRKYENESMDIYNKVDYKWICNKMEISNEKLMNVIEIRNTYMNNVSIDSIVGDGDTTLGEFIELDYNLEDDILDRDLKRNIKKCVNMLNERSRDIIIKRFGLDGQEPMTLESIGENYDVSRERIRQIEKKALLSLQTLSDVKKLKIYYEE